MPIRSLIVDDEPLARDLLRSMLEKHDAIEVVGEFGDGRAAKDGVLELDPDLLFLDVQMPEMTGLELLQDLPKDRLPDVVFVTAYDAYALKAFDLHAVDYLLKPFDEERLAEAVERARARIRGGRPEGPEQARVIELLEDLTSRERHRDRIPVTEGTRTYLVPVKDVEWFESDGKYVNIHRVGGTTHVIRETMIRLEEILDPRTFIRVSRGAIVNVDHIQEVQPWFHGDMAIILKSGTQVNTTKSFREGLKGVLGR